MIPVADFLHDVMIPVADFLHDMKIPVADDFLHDARMISYMT